jgi:hypothetical protein
MIKHYGEAPCGKPTVFDQEVEEHLRGMEAAVKRARNPKQRK